MRFLTSTATTKLDALDASVWDRFVAQDPQGHLLQTWAWGELKGRFAGLLCASLWSVMAR